MYQFGSTSLRFTGAGADACRARVEVVAARVNEVRGVHPESPLFLAGNSVGGFGQEPPASPI